MPTEMAGSRPNAPEAGEPPRGAQIENPLKGTSEYTKFVLDSGKRKNIQIFAVR